MQCLLKHNILSYYVRFFWFHFFFLLLLGFVDDESDFSVCVAFSTEQCGRQCVPNTFVMWLLCFGYLLWYLIALYIFIWHYSLCFSCVVYIFFLLHYVSILLLLIFQRFCFFFVWDWLCCFSSRRIVRILIFHRKFRYFFCYQIN